MITRINEEYAHPQCHNLQRVYLWNRAEIIAFLYMLLLCLYVKQSQIKSQVINIFTLILINEQLTLTHTQGLHCKCAQLLNFGSFFDNMMVLQVWRHLYHEKKNVAKQQTRHLCLLQTVRLHHVSMLQTGQGGVMWQHTVVFFKGDSR